MLLPVFTRIDRQLACHDHGSATLPSAAKKRAWTIREGTLAPQAAT
ncbi:hypothetical protein [Enhygromyxa salina]|nr:hypothetical protein [Enhygromyxa salina]